MTNPEAIDWELMYRSLQRLKLVIQLMRPVNEEAVQKICELMDTPLESFGNIVDFESDSYNVSRRKNFCRHLIRHQQYSEYMEPINREAEERINELLARTLDESFDDDE
ncbi:unnamed protein product [Cuscuta europaea]|uniref:Uncharacterized protein n=1 Tax=Cuscuta europaea TaxID=41803 RepID=A0A9P0Z5G4_CUSEU|nr:unnamed protein product [Cuscuta europaea]